MARLYPALRPLIHCLPPETAHNIAIKAIASGLLPSAGIPQYPGLAVSLAGLSLPNPVGLAAGFDKNAQTLPHIFGAGFGFVECGTVTPRPQEGNPKPRLFRLPQHEAVINRLGFNNLGLDTYVANLSAYHGAGIVGANIGKNKDTEDAASDYVLGLSRVYAHAAYVTVNISSPNTQGLRDLQAEGPLRLLLTALFAERKRLMTDGRPYKPLFVKIAPDLNDAQLEVIAGLATEYALDGLIISNTTINRDSVAGDSLASQTGGLSGKPLMVPSTEILRKFYRLTQGKIPLVGVGGIASAEDAYAKICAGATAVQLYSALVYQGLGLISRIITGLDALRGRDGHASIAAATGSRA